jgi:hypothetical protein
MNCCNADGTCDQGKDCPVRKQRIKEVNDMYIKAKQDSDPYVDTIGEFKTLLALLLVIVGLAMLAFAIWGRP